MHTETCNLACTDLLMNPDYTAKSGHSDLLCASKSAAKKVDANRHFEAAEPHGPWDAC